MPGASPSVMLDELTGSRMFEATCLGHHCWLFRAGDSALLVDPLLFDTFGHTPALDLVVWPRRAVDLSALPPLDAVFLTHEHEGHFDLASLDRIDRRVPVYVSARSSVALRTILAEMAFVVRPVHPGHMIELGALRLLPITADQVAYGVIEEWDLLPYLVWDTAGHGSFFTHVDMRIDARTIVTVRAHVPRIGVFAHTDNHHDYWPCRADGRPSSRELQRRVRQVLDIEEAIASTGAPPALSLLVGGGWAFVGEQAWLDRNVFLHHPEDVVGALRHLLPDQEVAFGGSGTAIRMVEGALVPGASAAPLVTRLSSSERRFVGDVPWLEEYSPATGRMEPADGELPDLLDALREFAAHLYGGPIFRALCSLEDGAPGGREPTFALVLRVGTEDALVLAYDLAACGFVAVEEPDPTERYLAVFECWATDLRAVLRAEVSPNALALGRHRSWNAHPTEPMDVNAALFRFAHPLRQPARFLALYRDTLARVVAARGDHGATA